MGKKLNILCIESDPADREAVRNYGDILDWSVTFARDCTEGFESASSRAFDLIVAKQDPPECDGIELANEVRLSQGPKSTTPVVLNTSRICENTREKARAAAIDALVQSPMLLSTFKAQLLRVVAQKRTARAFSLH